ncbi:MAG: sodium-dependent transporter [Anaerovoracaceae bacterium]
MNNQSNRSNFSGSIGFVLAAAGSAVGLGNIWRFPYLAAKDGGGLFILVYLILVVTFGFAMLTTEVAIGRKTAQGPLTAYGKINSKFKGLGILAWIVPIIIIPYYCAIGGWVLKYLAVFVTGGVSEAATDGFFTGHITQTVSPLVWMLIFLAFTALIVFLGVDKGIEKTSKIIMPVLFLLIIAISIFSLTLEHTDDAGVTRTGLQGLKVYLVPDFTGLTLKQLFVVIMDAMGQLFFSISVAMGIMVAYGSYVKKDANLMSSINQIEFFDTLVALVAGLMIVPAVFTFMGTEGMSAGPGLIFISLPKIFEAMGVAGRFIGLIFFLIVAFAALTSCVSIMEAIISGLMDKWHLSRKVSTAAATIYTLVMAVIVCLGYNLLYVEVTLPNGSVGQILDIMDYLSNSVFMPIVALLTCILIGWVAKPDTVIDEVTNGGQRKFGRKTLYIVMVKFVAPIMLFILLVQSFIH